MIAATGFIFRGHLDHAAFLEFARHRAARLDLRLAEGPASNAEVAVSVAGEPALIDAFEMACSLGPYDCIVLDVIRTEAPAGLAASHHRNLPS